jgi:hypothetical protein
MVFVGRGFTGCGKTQKAVILSEAKNLSLFLFLYLNRREILRFAQNDRSRHYFRSVFTRDVKWPDKRALAPGTPAELGLRAIYKITISFEQFSNEAWNTT